MAQIYCEKCKKTMDEGQFYSSRRLDKYPNGKFKKCKKCLTMHINSWDPSTFLPILEDADMPYVEHKWKEILDAAVNSGKKVTSLTVIGKYFSQMRLTQYSKYRWADSDKLNQEYREQTEAALEEAPITEEEKEEILKGGLGAPPAEIGFAEPESAPYDPANEYDEFDMMFLEDLTEEDRKYLAIKWGKYRPSQWVKLEQLFNDMCNSYDIQAAGHMDTLKLACKASLKSNELLDIGDMDGAKKAVAMYDSLMKSGKFTAAQNKAESGEAIDSVGELALLCEAEEGFIPVYYDGNPNDKVDKTLEDLKKYTYNLVVKEQGLGNLIESSLMAMQKDDSKEDLEDFGDEDDIELDEAEILEDLNPVETYNEMQDFLEAERALDESGGEA